MADIYALIGHANRWIYDGHFFWVKKIHQKVSVDEAETPNQKPQKKRGPISTFFSRLVGLPIGLTIGVIYGLIYSSVYQGANLFDMAFDIMADIILMKKPEREGNPPIKPIRILLGLPGIAIALFNCILLFPLSLVVRYLSECATAAYYSFQFLDNLVEGKEFDRKRAQDFYKERSVFRQSIWMVLAAPGTILGIMFAVTGFCTIAVANIATFGVVIPLVQHVFRNFLASGLRVLQEIPRMGTPEFNRTRFESNLLSFFTLGFMGKSLYKVVRGKTDLIYDDKKAVYLHRYTKDGAEHQAEKTQITEAYDKFNALNRTYEFGPLENKHKKTTLFFYKVKNNALKMYRLGENDPDQIPEKGYHPIIEKAALSILLKQYNKYIADATNADKSLDAFLNKVVPDNEIDNDIKLKNLVRLHGQTLHDELLDENTKMEADSDKVKNVVMAMRKRN